MTIYRLLLWLWGVGGVPVAPAGAARRNISRGDQLAYATLGLDLAACAATHVVASFCCRN